MTDEERITELVKSFTPKQMTIYLTDIIEQQTAEIDRLHSILEQWLDTAREHLDTAVAGRTFEALRRAK